MGQIPRSTERILVITEFPLFSFCKIPGLFPGHLLVFPPVFSKASKDRDQPTVTL